MAAIVAPQLGLLSKAQTEYFLANMKSATQSAEEDLVYSIKAGLSDEEIAERFMQKYCQGYIKEINPEDAALLNTSIMIRLIRNELLPYG